MRIFALISIFYLLTITNCKAQESAFNVNHGVVIEKIDPHMKKDIRFVHFDNSVGVIFPAAYGKQKFGENSSWLDCFTPDTDVVKSIDKEIIKQYCDASKRLNEGNWNTIIERLKADSDWKELKKVKRQRAVYKKRDAKFCDKWKSKLRYYDKQYLGVILFGDEKVIYIKLLDFREDPYNLKPIFYQSWIDGWHGWFETNTLTMYFHIKKNLLTINEN